MRFAKLLGISLLVFLVGCNRRPTNPAADVVDNPPEEINTTIHSEVEILLNGQPAVGETVSLTSGEKLKIDMKLTRRDTSVLPTISTLYIRVLPEGSTGTRWARLPLVEHFVCVPDILNGTMTLDTVVSAPTGTYEYRCFMMYLYATEEKPEFYLVSKGKFLVAEAAAVK
jgi:hypothetical protein